MLCEYLDALDGGGTPPERAAWARLGWLSDVRGWIEREVTRLGHAVTGIEQVKQWSISSVLLVHTDGPDVYFKVSAPLPLFVEEGPVTAMLSSRFPGYVPAPLAVEPEQGWMLLPELGELIGWKAPLEFRRAMFARFATLQRRSAEQADALIAAGCFDRRLDVLERQLEPARHRPRRGRATAFRGGRRTQTAASRLPGGMPQARRCRPAADARAR